MSNPFLSEPINFVSSIAFFISALFVYKLYRKKKIANFGLWFLFYLLILIGTGSILWHSFRNIYTLALDAVPVFIFLSTFIFLVLKKLFDSSTKSLAVVLGVILLQLGVSYFFPQVLNGSIRHFVFITFFIAIGAIIYRKTPSTRKDVIVALVLYSFAIIFRSLDNQICSSFPFGTHFLWHILNATASYFAIKVLVSLSSSVKK